MMIRCPVCAIECPCYFDHCADFVCHTKGCRADETRPLDHLGGPFKVIPVFVQVRDDKCHAFPLPATAADPENSVTVFFHYRDLVAYALVVLKIGGFYGLQLVEANEYLPEALQSAN